MPQPFAEAAVGDHIPLAPSTSFHQKFVEPLATGAGVLLFSILRCLPLWIGLWVLSVLMRNQNEDE